MKTRQAAENAVRNLSGSKSDAAAVNGLAADLRSLEALGRRAIGAFDQPDAGLWELRGSLRIHTFSSVMCWAACDRLARIAARLGIDDRAAAWRAEADRIHRFIDERCWSEKRHAYASTAGGVEMDASMLLLADLGLLAPNDPRFDGTVRAIQDAGGEALLLAQQAEQDVLGTDVVVQHALGFLGGEAQNALALGRQPARPAPTAHHGHFCQTGAAQEPG